MRELPNGWRETTLGEVAKIIMGQSPRGETCNESGIGLPLLNGPTEFGPHSPTPVQFTEDARMISKKNDILFCVRGSTTGKMNWADQEYAIGRGIAAIRHRQGNDFKYFIRGVIDNNLRGLLSIATGSTFPNISRNQLEKLELILPPLPEQRAIADVLSCLDDKIELLQQQNETLETLAQTIFKEWFVNFNYPGATGKMQDSELGEIPQGWRVGKLGEEFDVSIGRTPPRAEQHWFSDKPIGKKWASIKDIVNSGTYIFATSEYIVDEAVSKFNIPIIPVNTVILSFKMTVGKLAITTEEMLSNEAIAHMKIKTDSYLSSEYIYLCLQSLNFNSLGSTSSIVTAINSAIIKRIPIMVPDIEVMNGFNELIRPFFEKIKINTMQNQTLSKTRDILLPKLMSGEVRVEGFGD